MSLVSLDNIAQHLGSSAPYHPVPGQWSVEKAQAWYDALPWLAGTNYYPATAINQLEMWQAATWDPARIKLEMQWSQSLGFNTHRVYLHDLVWEADEEGLYQRMEEFLGICAAHNIRPFFCFFDDCHNPFPKVGEQPPPVPAYHNSGWNTCPPREDAIDFSQGQASEAVFNRLKGYVQRTIEHFANDERVLLWELYNEPGRGSDAPDVVIGGNLDDHTYGDQSAKLVHESWVWARDVNPSQPISSNSLGCVGDVNYSINVLNSDVQSIHCYEPLEGTKGFVELFEAYQRPIFLTEYIARHRGSTFEDIMPYLKEHKVAAINWGFVAGKSGTIWPWESRIRDGQYVSAETLRKEGKVEHKVEELPEPECWFHDVLRYDGSPYCEEEAKLIRSLTGA